MAPAGRRAALRLPRKAGWNGFGRLDEGVRRRVGRQERHDGRGGLGAPGTLATTARKKSRNSSPFRTGNPLCEWPMISVWTWSPRWNRTAIPWGLAASGSFSAAVGIPDVSENRTVTGVDGRLAWGARVSFPASGEGVNVPAHITPRA